jgi:DNA-binding IclR family transcriptional regulator
MQIQTPSCIVRIPYEELYVKSFEKIAEVLDCFSYGQDKLTLQQIVDLTGLPKSSAHRIVAALCSARYLEQISRNGRYRLGIKLFEFGSIYIEKLDLHKASFLIVRRLQETSGENVHLCIFNGNRPVMIYRKTMVTDPVNTVTTLEAAPAHCTGVGKAILAHIDDAQAQRIIASGLIAFTPQTLTDPAALREDLAAIRARGYALDDREHQTNTRCLAAPIRAVDGRVFAAVSISSSAERIPEERYEVLAGLVTEAASKIEQSLRRHAEAG